MIKINLSKIKKSRFHIFILVLTFVIYGNSINNEYALDDNIVVDGIEKVNKGLKGIPEIFTTHHAIDKKQSYDYRPIVLLTFAIEKQFFRRLPETQNLQEKEKKDKLTQANISHFINVLLYAFTGVVLFNFLVLLFSNYNVLLPLIVTLIFIVHPLHTEPVCNIKSRDELMMFLSILFALSNCLKFSNTGKYKYLFYTVIFIFLALLCKKTALLLFGILPVVMYYSRMKTKKILIGIGGIILAMIIVMAMKRGLLEERGSRVLKLLENPLFYSGDFMDRITMGLYCSWFYLKMLIFPKDLSFYYGYNTIPMANWSYYQVWLALLFYVPLGIFGVWKLIKREIIGIGLVLWLGVMLAYLNVLSPVVGIVADRFTYVFSLGYCIVLAYLLIKVFRIDLIKDSSIVNLPKGFVVIISLITIMYSGRTIARNSDWHDYLHLYEADIEHLGESAKAHALISNTMYPQMISEYRKNPNNPEVQKNIQTIIYHFKEAIRIDSTYETSLNNLGSVYLNFKKDYPNAIKYCEKAIIYDSNYVEAHFNLAYAYNGISDHDKTMMHIKRVIEIDANYLRIYDFLNQFLLKQNKVDEGIIMLEKLGSEVKNPKSLYMNIGNLYSSKGDGFYHKALHYYILAYNLDNNDNNLCKHIYKISVYLEELDLAKKFDCH